MRVFYRFVLLPATFVVLLCVVISCQGISGGGTVTVETVKIDSCRLADTTSFLKSNGEKCTIYAEATIEFPHSYQDKSTTEQLQRLFAAFVLNAPDSLSLEDAMRATVGNTLHQYDFVQQWPGDAQDEEDDGQSQAVYKYNTVTRVSVHYNTNQLITFCKTEMVKKNDKVTSVTHRYYNFDLKTVSYIDLHKLFRDDALGDVTTLLQHQLLAQNKATSNDQLNDLGYFNVDNLTVTRNFYFGNDGMTWSYLPSQLAVDAIGEPTITIPYEQLEPMACDGSVLERFN